MNLDGYPFVLPDMRCLNTQEERSPHKELFIRWLQANVFMPSLQFSYVPWDYDKETIEISQKFIKLHQKYSDLILFRFRLLTTVGEPVNPPIWWIDPHDTVAQSINDRELELHIGMFRPIYIFFPLEFLLGDQILVAPVLHETHRTRDVYLPNGNWIDGNSGEIYSGPKWLQNYNAPLDVLPYFIRQI